MGMNDTPLSERVHIGFFGRRNVGKSSLLNAVTGQNLAVVSPVKGTTTDPVSKTMELLPLGPVVLIDTPGIDDEGELGELRIRKSMQTLSRIDLAVLVVDITEGMTPEDRKLTAMLEEKQIPFLTVWNKIDLASGKTQIPEGENHIPVSAADGTGITELKERLASMRPSGRKKSLLDGLVSPQDTVVLVVPIDKSAPKGRLILPQQQTIRSLLDGGCICLTVRDTELAYALSCLKEKPQLVITDSQVFGSVSSVIPEDIPLTSFSILFARYKGSLARAVKSVQILDSLKEGAHILICEGCTHHRQGGDIGTVKLPEWICKYTGKTPRFTFTSGTEFPDDLSHYDFIVHCGACMLNEKEMQYRLTCAAEQGVPMANYGILIAYVHGILKRSVEPFPEISALLNDRSRGGAST